MGLITLPYSLTAHTDAKASEVMADVNKILALVNGGLDSANIAPGGVASTNVANAAIGKAQLSAGYTRRMATGALFIEVGGGFGFSLPVNIPHGLGEFPSAFDPVIVTAANYVIAIEFRVLSWDTINVTGQIIMSSPAPATTSFLVQWAAWGQP